MCLILFAHDVVPEYPLIVAANRDEYYVRATESARYWHENSGLLAGRDIQAGGTWLGITRSGRFAAITNFREGERSDAQHSRGHLTLDFLLTKQSPEQYLQTLQGTAAKFNGFNLLLGMPGDLHYFGNRAGPPQRLAAGVYALGNGTLYDDWHKMRKGKRDFCQAIAENIDPKALLQLMRDEFRPDDAQLPNTGVGLELERLLSARFIRSETYGTRATTVLLVDAGGRFVFIEQNYSAEGVVGKPRRFEARLSA